jgi:hypothetical protein
MDRFIDWIKNTDPSNLFLNFYEDNLEIFNCSRFMSYEIFTTHGCERIDLDFSENFRFKSVNGSFGLHSLPKQKRIDIVTHNKDSFLYVVDFRQFEFRTFLYLTGADVDYDELDLYEFYAKKLNLEKNNFKINLISHLYSDSSSYLNRELSKELILDSISDGFFVANKTPIYVGGSENKKSIHTIVQTYSYFDYLRKLSKILRLLDNKKSKFIFPLHDCMIFSIEGDEIDIIEQIDTILEDDIYKIKKYIGKNFLEIEEI